MIFIGYEVGTKAYRCFDPVNASIHISRDVVFEEGAKGDWSNHVESVSTLTFTPDLCVVPSLEDRPTSRGDFQEDHVKNHDEESTS